MNPVAVGLAKLSGPILKGAYLWLLSASLIINANTGLISSQLSLGTNPAQTGIIRLANNTGIYERNASSTGDIELMGVDASNNVVMGNTLITGALGIVGGSTINITAGSVNTISLTAGTSVDASVMVNTGSTGGGKQNGLGIASDDIWFQYNRSAATIFQTAAPSVNQGGAPSTAHTLSIYAQPGTQNTGGPGGKGGDVIVTGAIGGTGSSTNGAGGYAAILSGIRKQQITITASTYTVDANSTTSDWMVFTDSTSNTVAITLPPPTAGRELCVKDKTGKVTTHAVTVTHNASETIDGATTVTFTKNFDAVCVLSDGTNWAVESEYSSSIVP